MLRCLGAPQPASVVLGYGSLAGGLGLGLGVPGRHRGALPSSSGHELRQLRSRGAQVLGHPDPGRVGAESVAETGHLRCRLDPPGELARRQVEHAGTRVDHRLLGPDGQQGLLTQVQQHALAQGIGFRPPYPH